jgi:hypothetical protein
VDIERRILAKTDTASYYHYEAIATGTSAADYFARVKTAVIVGG